MHHTNFRSDSGLTTPFLLLVNKSHVDIHGYHVERVKVTLNLINFYLYTAKSQQKPQAALCCKLDPRRTQQRKHQHSYDPLRASALATVGKINLQQNQAQNHLT